MKAFADDKAPRRVLAVDILRGLVLVLLLPDLAGGFSFYKVAEAIPESPVWRALATQFQHVEWTGVALWDLVMPLFVFMVGVSMALSYASRRRAGQSEASLLWHAAIRSLALFLLGMLLQFKAQSRFEQLLPFLVLSTGLPIGRGLRRLVRRDETGTAEHIDIAYAVVVLVLVGAWVATHYRQLGHYEIGDSILALVGLAYLPAFLMQRWNLRHQVIATVSVLAIYWVAFTLYPVSPATPVAGQGVLPGTFVHWNKGTNLASAFDAWFLPMLPRGEPYRGNPHDYHSLLFVPLIAAILFGAIVGRLLAEHGPSRPLALRFIGASLLGIVLAGLMSATVSPLLKSLLTPTWSVFSSSACLLLLGSLMLLLGDRYRPIWAQPLVVLGTNSILLYVLASTERWRILSLWDRLLGGTGVPSLPWWPLLESCLVLATLWILAFGLYRAKIFVRL